MLPENMLFFYRMDDIFLENYLDMSTQNNDNIDQITSSLLDVSGTILEDPSSELLDTSNELQNLLMQQDHTMAIRGRLCDKVEASPVQNLAANSTKKLNTPHPPVEDSVESAAKGSLNLELENLKVRRPSKRDSFRKIGAGAGSEMGSNHHSRTRTRTQRGKMTHHANNAVQPKPKSAGKK